MNTSNAIINVLYMVKMMCIESILHNNRASRGTCWWSLAAEPIFGTPETLFYALRICVLFRMLFILRICRLPFTIYIMSETLSLHSWPHICHQASTKKELVQQKKNYINPTQRATRYR